MLKIYCYVIIGTLVVTGGLLLSVQTLSSLPCHSVLPMLLLTSPLILVMGLTSCSCLLLSMKVANRVVSRGVLEYSPPCAPPRPTHGCCRQEVALGLFLWSCCSTEDTKSLAAWLTSRKYSSGKQKSRRQMLTQVSSGDSSRNGETPLSIT